MSLYTDGCSLPGKMKQWLVLTVLLCVASACSGTDNPIAERACQADKPGGDIVIGAVGPWSSMEARLWQGIEMAVEEVNGAGGVLGRKLKVVRKDDEGSVAGGQTAAHELAENKSMVAVIGHYNSFISIPTSVIYEYYGLLMLSPLSTNPRLTRQGFKRVFRSIPDDEDFGKALAGFCVERGYKRVMVYHAGDEDGGGLANAFERQAEDVGLVIPDRLSYDSMAGSRIFRKDLSYWKDSFQFDALFVAGVPPQAAQFIHEARKLGITVPVIGGQGLDSPELFNLADKASENVFVASIFHPDVPDKDVAAFVEAFRSKYGALPDAAAAQGYDAVGLLARALTLAGSAVPDKIAEALRGTKGWKGVTGTHTYDAKGDLVDKNIFIKAARNGHFESMPIIANKPLPRDM